MRHAIRALRFFAVDWPRGVGALVLLTLTTGVGLLKPWPLAWIVDCVLGDRPLPQPWSAWIHSGSRPTLLMTLVGLMAALHLGHALLLALQNGLIIHLGLRGLARVRAAVFEWVLRLSMPRWNALPQGELIYRATWDTYAFQTLFNQGLFSVLSALFQMVAMAWVMRQVNPTLTGVALLTVPCLVGVMRLLGTRMARLAGVAQTADATLSARIQQAVSNLLLIQSFTRESTEAQEFVGRLNDSSQARWAQHTSEIIYLAAVAMVLGIGTASLVGLGASQVLAGKLTVGKLWVFLAYLAQLYEPLNQISQLGTTIANALAGTRRVLSLLDEPEIVTEGTKIPSFRSGTPPSLALIEVDFAYNGGQAVLSRVSFEVAPGEMVALIGPSGAGKTTLLQLIPRFLEPTRGIIRMDGIDIREFRRRSLRESIAVLLQEPLLLPTSIAENIAYGKPGAGLEEVVAAARRANADDFIRRLPQGYDTVVGDGAARLSVGEKQRLNLARAFLKDAPILLLDEPTSALDAESEALVMEGWMALARRRTTLMVAHRLTTLRSVDRYLELRAGHLVRVGTPSDLTSTGPGDAQNRGKIRE